MVQPSWHILACLAAVGCVLQCCFIRADLSKRYGLAALLKACASSCFVAIGLLGTSAGSPLVAAGLVLGAIGDVLHALRFVTQVACHFPHLFTLGGIAFLLGHCCYLAFLARQHELFGIAIALGLVVGGLVLLLLSRKIAIRGKRAAMGAVYLLVVAQVFSFSAMRFAVNPSGESLAFCLGALLFLLSDSLLALNTFGPGRTAGKRVASLGTYYAAQLLIALSVA